MKTTQVISFGLLMAPLFVRASLADGVKQSSIPPHIDISSSCAKELNSTKINFVLRKVPQIITESRTGPDPLTKMIEKVNPKHNRIFYHQFPLDSDESAIEHSEEVARSELYAFYPRSQPEENRKNAKTRTRREISKPHSDINRTENTAYKAKVYSNSTKPRTSWSARGLSYRLLGALEKSRSAILQKSRRAINRTKRAHDYEDDLSSNESTDFRDISQAGNDDPEIEEMFLKHMARLSPGTLARVVDRIAQVANLQEPSEEIAI